MTLALRHATCVACDANLVEIPGGPAVRRVSRRNFMQGMSSLLVLPLLRREEPEIVLYNGNIWTVDELQPRAQAVAISGGRFAAVGSNEDVLRLATARTRKNDLASKS